MGHLIGLFLSGLADPFLGTSGKRYQSLPGDESDDSENTQPQICSPSSHPVGRLGVNSSKLSTGLTSPNPVLL